MQKSFLDMAEAVGLPRKNAYKMREVALITDYPLSTLYEEAAADRLKTFIPPGRTRGKRRGMDRNGEGEECLKKRKARPPWKVSAHPSVKTVEVYHIPTGSACAGACRGCSRPPGRCG